MLELVRHPVWRRAWRLTRPLDPFRSVKAALGWLVVISVAITTLLCLLAYRSDIEVQVIAIIAIIASLMLPAISMVKGSAQTTKCGSNLRQIYIGTMAYADDHEDAVPPAHLNFGGTHDQFWFDRVAPYADTGEKGVESGNKVYGVNRTARLKRTSVVWGCPNNPSLRTPVTNANNYKVGYGMNHQLGLPASSKTSYNYHTTNYTVFTFASLTHTSTRPLIVDSNEARMINKTNPPTPPRHKGKLGGVFCDGHVGLETWARWIALRANPAIP